jgi:S-adenosylmethionine:tRNA ribosyltransferase-isomerase
VGTTTVRALEAAALEARAQNATDPIVACAGATRLLLQPGARLSIVDGLLTNFHLPRSTLLALVASLVGLDNLRAAYAHAISHGYRFYSYGDAMLVTRVLDPEVVASTVPREGGRERSSTPERPRDSRERGPLQ